MALDSGKLTGTKKKEIHHRERTLVMSRRRSRISSGSQGLAAQSPLSRQTDIIEFKRLLGEIRARLSRLSQTQGETMSFHFQQAYTQRRPNRSPARVEAEALYHMVQSGRDTIDNVRELIAVPPKLEAYVRELSFPHAGEQKRLLASLRFRQQVSKEFESLVTGEQVAAVAAGAGSGNS
jgi:hypothetical protein